MEKEKAATPSFPAALAMQWRIAAIDLRQQALMLDIKEQQTDKIALPRARAETLEQCAKHVAEMDTKPKCEVPDNPKGSKTF